MSPSVHLERPKSATRRREVLAGATLAMALTIIDFSIVPVALPEIQAEFDVSDVGQRWIVNAYLLTMGTFAIAGGRAGDRYGRRRVLFAGIGIFVAGSVLSGLAQSEGTLIAARAAQGIGAATITTGTVALVTDAWSGRGLGRAIGILVGVASVGVPLGALLGGVLIELAGWRAIFFVNVPVAALVIVLIGRSTEERRSVEAPRLDLPGLASLTVGVTALTVTAMQATVWGLGSAATLTALAVAAGALAAWWKIEGRAPYPLVELGLLRGPPLGANFVAFAATFLRAGIAVLLAIYLQNVLGYSALETGLLMLPLTVPTMIGALASGWVLDRFGGRTAISVAMIASGAGAFMIGLGARADDYAALLPGLLVFALFAALALPATATTLIGSAGAGDRGMVSGVYATARLIGSVIGLALMGALLAGLEQARLADELGTRQIDSVEETRIHNLLARGGGDAPELAHLPRSEAEEIESGARAVFDDAFATTLQLAALLAVCAGLVAFRVVPRLRAPPAHATQEV